MEVDFDSRLMDQRAFVFATGGLSIKGQQCQNVRINNKIFVCV